MDAWFTQFYHSILIDCILAAPFECSFNTIATSTNAQITSTADTSTSSAPDQETQTTQFIIALNISESGSASVTTSVPDSSRNATVSGLSIGIIAGASGGALLVVVLFTLVTITICIVRRKVHVVAKKQDTITSANITPSRYEMTNPERSQSMEMKRNDAYVTKTTQSVTSVDSDQLYATVDEDHAEATANGMTISMKTNTCYGTTAIPVDADQLYATVEGEHDIKHTKIVVEGNDYNDYVIP